MSVRTPRFSRREQEMMDIVYAEGSATAAQVREHMADPPTDAAVRTTLRSLVSKGHLRIEQDGPRYVYWPTVPRDKARSTELAHVLETFFGGSAESAMVALLQLKAGDLTDEERQRLKQLIDRAASEGR
jgi:predicted transcriptional regulator